MEIKSVRKSPWKATMVPGKRFCRQNFLKVDAHGVPETKTPTHC